MMAMKAQMKFIWLPASSLLIIHFFRTGAVISAIVWSGSLVVFVRAIRQEIIVT